MAMEKKKYLFPDFMIADELRDVIIMSGTWDDTDDFDTILEGGWLI